MKKLLIGFVVGTLLGAAVLAIGEEVFYKGKIAYIKVDQENLRGAPGGEKIGTLIKGTPLQVLAVEDKWVRVATVGYVWKESLTGDARMFRGKPFHAAMILVRTEAEAQAIVQEIQNGADFAQLAAQKSIDDKTKAKGGDLGEAYPGDFSPTFEQAILALQVGQVSPPVKTENGYYIFKRLK